jgi:hypothetical protein
MVVRRTTHEAQRNKTLLSLVTAHALMVLSACTGEKAGHGVGPGCSVEPIPLPDLEQVPRGFERSPLEILAPVTSGIDGTLTLTDGTEVPLSLAFELDAESAYEFHLQPTDDFPECKGDGVEIKAAVSIDGGDILQGQATATILVLDGEILVRIEDPALTTTPPRDSQDAALIMGLQLDASCRWSGGFAWSTPADCGDTPCVATSRDKHPIGNFEAQGACE